MKPGDRKKSFSHWLLLNPEAVYQPPLLPCPTPSSRVVHLSAKQVDKKIISASSRLPVACLYCLFRHKARRHKAQLKY
uniref:Uncharacterized protein n=1 Tax=Aegilops tauschii subsp. strangulata TaxID=200361 RepID=A0A453QSD2_AEGTS